MKVKKALLVVAVLFGMVLSPAGKSQASSMASEIINSLPKEIPGVAQIDIYENPEASQVIFFIPWVHRTDGMRKANIILVAKAQEEVYWILDYLVTNYGIHSVYSEGVCLGDEQAEARSDQRMEYLLKTNPKIGGQCSRRIQQLEKQQKRLSNELDIAQGLPEGKFVVNDRAFRLLRQFAAVQAELTFRQKLLNNINVYLNCYLATTQLEEEGKITVLAAETLKTNRRAGLIMDALSIVYEDDEDAMEADPLYDRAVKNDREDILRIIIQDDQSSIIPVVYGGGHDLCDALGDKYSLVVFWSPTVLKRVEFGKKGDKEGLLRWYKELESEQ